MPKLLITLSIICLCLASCHFVEIEGQTATVQKWQPFANEEAFELDIEVPVGKLEIEAGSADKLYEYDLQYNENAFTPEVEFDRRGNTAVLRFRLSGEGKSVRRVGKTRLNLRLNPNIPIALRGKTGVGESHIDLGGMKVRELDLRNGVGETRVSMLSPNRITCDRANIENGVGSLKMTGLGNLAFRQLTFQGGVGGSELDFSGDWREQGDIRIDVGVGGVQLRVPRSIGAEVQASKTFLSGVDLPQFDRRGDTYVSYNIDRVSRVIRLRIHAGIGGVELKWI
jgi:hypothetical protein